MLPLVLNPIHVKAGLAGSGAARDRRAALLADAGVEVRLLPDVISDALLDGLQILFDAQDGCWWTIGLASGRGCALPGG